VTDTVDDAPKCKVDSLFVGDVASGAQTRLRMCVGNVEPWDTDGTGTWDSETVPTVEQDATVDGTVDTVIVLLLLD
jgi:hypothetical protein